MARKKEYINSHTDLPEKAQLTAIEIIASTQMPIENAMPTYTHTQTSTHTISFDPTPPQKLLELPAAELYKLEPLEWSTYYHEAKEANIGIIESFHTELLRWELYIFMMEGRKPITSEYNKKIEELYQSLPLIELKDESGKPCLNKLFPNGPHDTMFCGLYLILNGCTPQAVKLLSGIQHLMLKKAELTVQQPSVAAEEKTMPKAEAKEDMDEDTALLHWLMDYDYLNEKSTPHPTIYVLEAIRDFLRFREIPWAKNCSSFTQKLSDEKLTQKTSGALAKDMTRSLTFLKIDNSNDYIKLQDLGLTDLEKQLSKHAADREFKKLKAIYAQVKSRAEEFRERQIKDKAKTSQRHKDKQRQPTSKDSNY